MRVLGIENKWAAAVYLACMAGALACVLIGLWGWIRARRRARTLSLRRAVRRQRDEQQPQP